MGNKEFTDLAKKMVTVYANVGYAKRGEEPIKPEDVYVVWLSKVLQNNKALLSSPRNDGMYYEVTYNGDKQEFYLDAYHKVKNIALTAEKVATIFD